MKGIPYSGEYTKKWHEAYEAQKRADGGPAGYQDIPPPPPKEKIAPCSWEPTFCMKD